MPELPDVEAFREVLAGCAQGAVIRRVDVYDTGVLHDVTVRRLRRELEGRTFGAPERHGKWLLARTGPDGAGTAARTVLLHFGMTGRLVCAGTDEQRHPHDRVVFTVQPAGSTGGSGGRPARCQLRYRDQRKLKGLWLVDDAGAERMLADQGPDAGEVRRAEFDELLARRRGGLKSVLAGLGNLLADEILWRARLAPDTPVGELSGADRGRLYARMRSTLDAAVRAGRVPDRDSWLTGRRDAASARCPRCGGPLRRDRVSGRATVWCPHCQGDGDGGRHGDGGRSRTRT